MPASPAVTIIVNRSLPDDERDALHTAVGDVLLAAGCKAEWIELQAGEDLLIRCEPIVQQAAAVGGVVVAAGGDGTVNAIAMLCYRHKATLGVLPMGTFNYFARELLIPLDPAEAAAVIAGGVTTTANAGFVKERLFLNNASFGLYTKIIRRRERANSRFGRLRIVAAISAALSLFQTHRRLHVTLSSGDQQITRRTLMVFVGNNTLQLDNLGLQVANCTRQGMLAVIVLKRTTWGETARILLRGMVKNLKDESKLEEFCTDHFTVSTRKRSMDVVIDGEIIHCRTPLEFRVERNALTVLVPALKVAG